MAVTMFEFDTSELHQLAHDIDGAAERVDRELPRIMRKAGVKIKDNWRAEAAKSRHFRIAPTISFDERSHGFSGATVHEIEVGPDRRFPAARLAGIAHFGGSNGGGGTLGDPQRFLDKEAPEVEAQIAALVDRILG